MRGEEIRVLLEVSLEVKHLKVLNLEAVVLILKEFLLVFIVSNHH